MFHVHMQAPELKTRGGRAQEVSNEKCEERSTDRSDSSDEWLCEGPRETCGSGLARDETITFNIDVDRQAPIASRPALTFFLPNEQAFVAA
jgi:hypothetical protein